MSRVILTKEQWIEMYGGQHILDDEGYDVVSCIDCDDSICHGWRVQPKPKSGTIPNLQGIPINTPEGRRIRRAFTGKGKA